MHPNLHHKPPWYHVHFGSHIYDIRNVRVYNGLKFLNILNTNLYQLIDFVYMYRHGPTWIFIPGKVEKPKIVNDHYWCFRPGIVWFLCGPKMTNYKSGGLKRLDGSQLNLPRWFEVSNANSWCCHFPLFIKSKLQESPNILHLQFPWLSRLFLPYSSLKG
jgi:hypothetical protein